MSCDVIYVTALFYACIFRVNLLKLPQEFRKLSLLMLDKLSFISNINY